MRILPTFDPSAKTSGVIAVGAADQGAKLLIYNESSINVALDFLNGNQCVIHANEARIVVLDGNTGEIHWFQHSVVAVIGSSISLFIMELYGGSEEVEGTYPISLTRTTITGNPSGVTTTVTSTQSTLTNDGGAAATSIVEATQATSTGSNVSITNSGNAYIAEYVTSVYQKIFQVIAGATTGIILGATNRAVQIVGDLFFKGTLGVVVAGDILDGGSTGTTYIKVRGAAGSIILQANGVQIMQIDSTGSIGIISPRDLIDVGAGAQTYFKGRGTNAAVIIQAQGTGQAQLQSGGGTTLAADGANGVYIPSRKIGGAASADLIDGSGTGVFIKGTAAGGGFAFQAPNGTTTWSLKKVTHGTVVAVSGGTVTITHNLGATPDAVFITPNNGAAGSQTFAVWNVGSTTFQIFNQTNTPTYYWEAKIY